MPNSTLFLNRFAPHYRKGIFTAMSEELNVDFYFGDKKRGQIRKLDYSCLSTFKSELKNIEFGESIYWQKGALKLIFKPYKNYILMGDMSSITTWIILFSIKFFRKKNAFLWTHGWYGNESKQRILFKRLFYSFSKGIFLYGDYAKKLMIDRGFKSSKLHVVYNSLEYEKHITLRNSVSSSTWFIDHFKNKNKNLIFVGRLTQVKKLHLAIEALNFLKNQNQNYNLTFIGDGIMMKDLQNLSTQLGLNKQILFYGACYDEEKLSELIYNADLCISPGNVGLTAMHALTFGTPVITHNRFSKQMPEFEAIKEGFSGSFFEYDNIESMAERIRTWFELNIDRETIRSNCFEIIDSKYNPRFQVSVMRNAINNI